MMLVEGEPKKRPQVRKACVNCQKAHACCEDKRPCKRCLNMGVPEQCIDTERKKRGRKKKSEIEATINGSSQNKDGTYTEHDTPTSPATTQSSTSRRSSRARMKRFVGIERELSDGEADLLEQCEEDNSTRLTNQKKTKYEEPTEPKYDDTQQILLRTPTPILHTSPFSDNAFSRHEPAQFPSDDTFTTPSANTPDYDTIHQQLQIQVDHRHREDVRTRQQLSHHSPSHSVMQELQSASIGGNQSEFVQKLLLELQTMKQRMESHSEEIKGLKAQNQMLLEQLTLETYKHAAQTKLNFDDLAFSYAYDNAGLAMAIISVSPPGQLLSSNKAFAKLLSSMNLRNIKYAQEMFFNQNDVNSHSGQWYDCYNAYMRKIGDRQYFNSGTQEKMDEPISYMATARVSMGSGTYQDLSYNCSIICDNNKKPLYSLVCICLQVQSRQFQEPPLVPMNYNQRTSIAQGHNTFGGYSPTISQPTTNYYSQQQQMNQNTSSSMRTPPNMQIPTHSQMQRNEYTMNQNQISRYRQ
jgi:hypothetical protein